MPRPKYVWLAALVIAGVLAVAVILGQISPHEQKSGVELQKLVIVVNPGVSTKVSVAEAQELEQLLEEEIGLDAEIYYPLSAAALVEALKFGHAHVALGPGALVSALALREAEVEMLLVEYREVIIDNKPVVAPFYYSYFIVLKDSPYVALEELKGKKICFPSETSVSGFIMPMKLLADKGYITPKGEPPSKLAEQFFGEVVFGSGYAQCWEALKKGKVDVTVMAGDVAASLYWEAMNNSRVLRLRDGSEAVAGPNPAHTVLIRRDLPPELKEKVKAALLKLNERPELMRKYVSAIFVKFGERSAEEHLRPLMDALDQLKLRDYYLKR
ncbi:MAG: phosphate/phosphite/phosphonate ABC transporter substrate-binding protein [Pyrobaculum sp.]